MGWTSKARVSESCAWNLEHKKFMSNSGEASDKFGLEFPIDPGFYSAPPKMTLERYLKFCEPKVPYGDRDRRNGPDKTRPPEEPFEL